MFAYYLLVQVQTNQYIATMVLDSLSSPHRRSQNTFFVSSAKKPQSSRDDSWSALFERHRFLLTTLVVLAFLCTIYLYFAVTFGADACARLSGAERIECQAKSVLRHGKLKFLWLLESLETHWWRPKYWVLYVLWSQVLFFIPWICIFFGGGDLYSCPCTWTEIFCTGRGNKFNSDRAEFAETARGR